MLILIIIICMFLLAIAWQDFKYRAVYWWLFPLLFVALGLWQYFLQNSGVLSDKIFYNNSFIAFQLLFIWAYLSLKEHRAVNIFKGYFGLGDLLFLISISVYFSFLNYAVFYLSSLFLVIVFSLVKNMLAKKEDIKIPLAGYQAILVMICILVDEFFLKINFGSDVWLVNYLSL